MNGRVVGAARGQWFLACLIVMALTSSGCGHASATVSEPEVSARITSLLRLYQAYANKHKKGPGNEAALLEFGQKLTPAEREAYLIKEPIEAIFTSPRDKQKFVVRYNQKIDPGQNRAIAWEATGVKGKKYTALSIGYIEEYDEATLKDYTK
jgi:methionine-rich copper-binding protein CopC